MSYLSITVGFPISLLIFYVFFIKVKNYNKFFQNPIINVFFAQIFLLICFCQGRGYYYLSPIILVISQLNYFSFAIVKLNKIFKNIFLIFNAFQFLVFLAFISSSIYQNFNAIINYDSFMNNNAYGYLSSKFLHEKDSGKTLMLGRNARLFYNTNYVDSHLFRDCILKNNNVDENKIQEYCLEKYNISTVLANEGDFYLNKEYFSCNSIKNSSGSRNPFLRIKSKFLICKLKKY